MKIKRLYIPLTGILLLLAPLFTAVAQQANRPLHDDLDSHRDYNPWEQSLNPAGIQLTEVDSLMEVAIRYDNRHFALTATDEPSSRQSYSGTVGGYKRLGALQLSGGMGWRQDRLKGQSWNYLVQPGYLVAAGDSLGDTRHTEQYSIYGKAAYAFPNRLLAGLSAAYAATDNKDASPLKWYTGSAHTADLTAGLIRRGNHFSTGLSAAYTHRTEQLSYGVKNYQRLYTYPLGYFTPMQGFNSGGGTTNASASSCYLLRSAGNAWQAALQAEWHEADRTWFNELRAGTERRILSPDDSGNLHGWKELYSILAYLSRLSLRHGRWTHLVSPTVRLQRIRSDRYLQRPDPENTNNSWIRIGSLPFASRYTADVAVSYEPARDYTPDGSSLAWQLTAGWSGRRDEFYSYPYTVAQRTGTYRVEAAFVRRLALTHAARLMLRPSISLLTGSGTEERVTEAATNASVEIEAYRDYARVSSAFAALTATRVLAGLQAEYRHPLPYHVDGGLRVQAGMEQVVRNCSSYRADRTGGGVTVSLIVWL